MKVPIGVPVIRNNNLGAVIISKELFLSENFKHIEVQYQYFCNVVAKNQLKIEDISMQDMVADIMTKPLGPIMVAQAQNQLHLVCAD